MAHDQPKAANSMASESTDLAVERTTMAKERTDLAVERTIMAADRSLMAWIRTGLSMQGFGFAIYKFLLYVRQGLSGDTFKAQGPRHLGLVLIGLGTVCTLVGLIEYYWLFKRLGSRCDRTPWSFAFFMGVCASLLGLFMLVTMIIHREVF
ncbi:MAG: DUF202 domain-containing protein [Chlamydiota bacterium]